MKISSVRRVCDPLPAARADSRCHARPHDVRAGGRPSPTDDGLVGHGFTSATHGGAEVIVNLIRTMLEPVLVGRDPFHVRGLWDEMFWRTQIVGRGGVARLGMGAVDIALWDLNARALGVPLWKLLGGTGVDRFPLYNTDAGWLSFPQDVMIAKDARRPRGGVPRRKDEDRLAGSGCGSRDASRRCARPLGRSTCR